MPAKKKRQAASSSGSPSKESPQETQFLPRDDDDETMWEAEAILDEDPGKKKFLLKWAGVDPHTGEPWAHSWEDKNGVTQNLIDEWKAKKKRDPLLVGKFRREEDQRRKAAHAAGAAKARAAKEGQVRKRKRTAESARSNESPKKTRREAGRQVSVVSSASSAIKRGTSRAPKRDARTAATVSPTEQKQPAAKSSVRSRRAAFVDDTSFETRDSEEDQNDSFHPPSSSPRAETARRAIRASKSRSVEAGAPTRAARSTSTTGRKDVGSEDSAAPSKSTVAPREMTPEDERSNAKAPTNARADGFSPAVPADTRRSMVERNGLQSPLPAQSSEALRQGADRPSNAYTPQSKDASSSPIAPPSQRPHTLLEGAISPNIVITRRNRVDPVQPAPALVRQNEPETQTTDTDKSVPISQADPIVDFSSPSHAESSSAARQRAQRPRISDSTANTASQPTRSTKLVPKVIDGEIWMTSPDSDEEEAAAAEGEVASVPAGFNNDPAELASPPAKKRSIATSADLEGSVLVRDIKIAELEVVIAKLQEQLALIPLPVPAVDPRVLEERDTLIQQLREELAEAQTKAVPPSPTIPIVDPALIAQKDAKIVELESTVATLSSSLIAAGKRGSEPSAETHELKRGNEFLIAQMDEATTRFEQAERELLAARAQIAQLDNGIPPADTAAVESLQAELAAAQAEKDALTRKVKTLSDENDFFRQQYQQASNSAVESVRQARELEDEVEKLRSQLKLGLKQRNMHYEAIHAKREAEAVKLRATNAILLEQSRRTDDAVRRKAALYDKYRTENEQLREHESAWQDRYAALQERNEELADQVAALRGKQMGVFDDDEGESDYTEGDAEDDITDDDRPGGGSSGVGYGTRETIGGFTSSQLGSQTAEAGGDDVFRSLPAPVPLRGGQLDEEQVAEGEVESLVEGEALRCHWRDDQTQCDLAFDRLEDLAHHGRAHAYEYEVKVEG